jgi:DHA2 family methylenomycin A resistance protein-like MFS transporter
MLAAGALGDRFGARRAFRFGLAVFALASIACGAATSGLGLNASRAVQGLGAAAMLPNSLALLNESLADTPHRRARALGWWTAAGAVSIALGPVIGGLLLSQMGWRPIFWINVPLCLVGLMLSTRLEETPHRLRGRGIDLAGQFSATFALIALCAAIIEWRPLGLLHPVVFGGLLFAAALALLFVRIEGRSRDPIVPLELFSQRRFRAAVLFGVIVNFTYYGTLFVLSLYFQEGLGVSALSTGLAFLPLTAGFFVSNVLSGRLVEAFGARVPMVLGALIDLAGFVLLYFDTGQASSGTLLLPFILIPGGMGLAVPAMTSTVLSSVPGSHAGTASAVLNTARQAAGALGVAAFGALTTGGGQAIGRAVATAAASSALLLACAALVAWSIGPKEACDPVAPRRV